MIAVTADISGRSRGGVRDDVRRVPAASRSGERRAPVVLIVKNGMILLDFTRRRMREAGLPLALALGVIGGLALSTPFTLFVIPTLLVTIRGWGFRLRSDPA
jgi:multidrug efflux pump subunit AcrB